MFNNTKTFLCEAGIMHWGSQPQRLCVRCPDPPDPRRELRAAVLHAAAGRLVLDAGWTAAASLPALLAATGATYLTAQDTCFVRIPPTNIGSFSASGLEVPNMTWSGSPTPTTYFTIATGCSTSNAACQSVVSTAPLLP